MSIVAQARPVDTPRPYGSAKPVYCSGGKRIYNPLEIEEYESSKNLWVAVLAQGLEEAVRNDASPDDVAWLFGKDFKEVCDNAGFEPSAVMEYTAKKRQEVTAMVPRPGRVHRQRAVSMQELTCNAVLVTLTLDDGTEMTGTPSELKQAFRKRIVSTQETTEATFALPDGSIIKGTAKELKPSLDRLSAAA